MMKKEAARLERNKVEQLENILGKQFSVLNDGFVRLIDYMGNDESIVQAARVSYGAGTEKVHEDRGLIRYLMRHRHTTPFEMCEIKFHVRVPMDCWRQWIRHRTANVNEYSTRYSIAIDECAITAPGEWRLQSGGNRQGSDGLLGEPEGMDLSRGELKLQEAIRAEYDKRIKKGVAREQARKDLSLSTYTEAYWKIDLHNLLHFLSLRLDSHAQKEIRDYAVAMANIVAKWVPMVWEAFDDYVMKAVRFTWQETQILACMLKNQPNTALDCARDWLDRGETGKLKKHRERDEFEAKLKNLGVKAPWRE